MNSILILLPWVSNAESVSCSVSQFPHLLNETNVISPNQHLQGLTVLWDAQPKVSYGVKSQAGLSVLSEAE